MRPSARSKRCSAAVVGSRSIWACTLASSACNWSGASPASALKRASPTASTMACALCRMPRSPSTVRLAQGSGRPRQTAPAAVGAPSPMECTSVVAPPGSTTSSGPRPPSPASAPGPRASSWAASSTAAGVGISTLSSRPRTRSMPLACTMRCMKTLRIASRAESIASTFSSGITLSARTAAGSRSATSSAASRLPATMIGQSSAAPASCRALCTMVSRLPPSVPPHSSSTSGANRLISARSARVRRPAWLPTRRAPAPSAARRAASAVSSRTSPTVTMRKPPAALDAASRQR